MNMNDFATFVEEILKEIADLSREHGLKREQLEGELRFHEKNFKSYFSNYDTPGRCLAYALRYGIKTSFQTWLNLKDKKIQGNYEHLVLIGGGCAFELLLLMRILKNKRLNVVIIDRYADEWKILLPVLKNMARKMEVTLALRFTEPKAQLKEQIARCRPDLVILSNMLNEIPWPKVEELDQAIESFPLYVQDLFVIEKIARLTNQNVKKTQLEKFPQIRLPEEFSGWNFLQNFEREMFYNCRNFIKWE